MAESEDFRHWEAERREVKRAEVRLTHGLRSLEEARLSSLNAITKEQKRLQQELQALQKSEEPKASGFIQRRSKQKLILGTRGIGINMALPLLSHQTRWDNSSRDAAQRTMRKTLPKPGGLTATSPSPSHSYSSNASGCEDEKGHLPPLKTKDQISVVDSEVNALKNSITKQLSISVESMQGEEPDSGQEQGKCLTTKVIRDTGVKGPTAKLMNPPWKRRPPLTHERLVVDSEAYAADGCLRTMYFRPDFPKSYAEARKFRYIRHKNIPAWEKELGLEEIFGHKIPTDRSPQTQATMNSKP